MIDLHAHILYGMDDGPETKNETMAMLQIAVDEGIQTMVATPHFIHGANSYDPCHFNVRLAEIQEQIQTQALPITLLAGNEMMMDEWTPKNYHSKSVRTLAGSRYALVEFPLMEIPNYAENVLDGLLKKGFIPLIAHPERYLEVQEDPGLLERFIQKGCLMQVNSGSITGIYGRSAATTAKSLLTHLMVHMVASDCHSTGRRAPRLREARLQVKDWLGEETTNQLFEKNPFAIINNQPVEVNEPLNIQRAHSVWHKMKSWFSHR